MRSVNMDKVFIKGHVALMDAQETFGRRTLDSNDGMEDSCMNLIYDHISKVRDSMTKCVRRLDSSVIKCVRRLDSSAIMRLTI